MTVDRGRLLDAAARVYGEFGFRGATTRRIADEAGVNEITIFRHFGSKETLINEAIRTHAIRPLLPDLPEVPVDPMSELTEWCAAVLAHLSDARSLIRRMMSEMEERPDVAPCVGDGPMYATLRLRAYVGRLGQHAFLEPPQPDVAAAVSMLMSALFADAMGRELMPSMYPQPAERAASAYVSLFLRALGVLTKPARPAKHVTPATARSA
jgi:AcrR family transcriptional regulator